VSRRASPSRSPTPALLLGLVVTLVAVVAYSYYITLQIAALRQVQSDLVDRNRRDSLQLLRVQNNLNLLGLAMRDMLEGDQPYPLTAWAGQFQRIRGDLSDALARDTHLSGEQADSAGRGRLADSLTQFWDAVDRTFAMAAGDREDEARAQIRLSLQARQAALTSDVARLLVENNSRDEQTAARVQGIYDRVQRQVYWFLSATLVAIAATSLYLIRVNRRLFGALAALSEGRRELAQQLIATRESTLRHVSRELHDELGQILTAMGSMLGRTERQIPPASPLAADLREIGEMAQSTLTTVRSLSQSLHPSILDELGLESTFEWYLGTVEKQLGIAVTYERSGNPVPVDATIGIHIYRVLQEALSNVARHSGADRALVRLRYRDGEIELEVEDHGSGLPTAAPSHRGLGLVAMRERAELVGGTLDFARPDEGGARVRLRVPIDDSDGSEPAATGRERS
jgi:signal transduction histidine kinase